MPHNMPALVARNDGFQMPSQQMGKRNHFVHDFRSQAKVRLDAERYDVAAESFAVEAALRELFRGVR
jgi:hypothetical protein